LPTNTQIFASSACWLEQNAIDQLNTVSGLTDVFQCCAFPDLHAGKGSPIGLALATRNTIYPHIIGNDVACGMALFATELDTRGFKIDRTMRQLDRYASFAEIPLDGLRVADQADPALGTIGGGNHFAEFTTLESADSPAELGGLAIAAGQVCLLVHSGSRGLGEALLRQALSRFQAQHGLAESSEGAGWYLGEHEQALEWAKANRRQVARRCLAALGVKDSSRLVLDIVHNGLERYQLDGRAAWVHRKGAAKADSGPVIIPGSRGSYSYLVQPLRPDASSLFSLAHGAGRKWQRGAVAGKLGDKYTTDSIRRTRLGSQVFCRDRGLLFEEAPEAYKNIEQVIGSLVDAGLARVIARFRPLLTVKY
jgi:release factor H-coupled RctB family protein